MKIMTAMYTLKKGGAYDRFIMMEEAFLERNCEVHCLSLTPIQIKHPYYHNHVTSFPFGIKGGWVARLTVLFLFPLYSLLIGWREKIDLFVAFGSLYAFMLAIPKWMLKRPMVTLIRGDFAYGLKMQKSSKYFPLFKFIEYLGLIFSDHIITNNTAIQNQIIRIIGRRKQVEIELLMNNIPSIPHFKPEDVLQTRAQFEIPLDSKVLVTAGVINKGKNIEILIKCLPKIEINNLFLLIIGDGSTKADFRYQDYLKKLTDSLDLGKRVIFTGWLKKEELWKIFQSADLFVLLSISEGMPNVILEALGVDLPCLGSNIPGVNDILQYEELLFDPLDEEVIAKKIWQFFSESLVYDKIRKLCQERKSLFIFDWKEEVSQKVIGLRRHGS